MTTEEKILFKKEILSQNNITNHGELFLNMAKAYLIHAEKNLEWTEIVNSWTHYHYGLRILEYKRENDIIYESNISKLALNINVPLSNNYVKNIVHLRETVKLKLKEDNSHSNIREIQKYIQTSIIKWLSLLFTDGEKLFGPARCKYTVVGLTSLASGLITPYSDLEFAILVDTSSMTIDISNYFVILSRYVYLQVVSLGETIIFRSQYDANLPYYRPGLCFDLGGHTPLGRPDKSFSLIQNVQGMLNYLIDEKATDNRNLPYVLEETCFIYGDSNLLKEYQVKSQAFLAQNGIKRTQKLFSEDIKNCSYSKFAIDLSFDFPGSLLHVKKNFYRLCERGIYHLAILSNFLGIVSNSEMNRWVILDILREKQIIPESFFHNLKKCLDYSVRLRLQCYSHYGYQKHEVNINHPFTKIFYLPSNQDAIDFYSIILPLFVKMKEYLSTFTTELTSSSSSFHFLSNFFAEEKLKNNSEDLGKNIKNRLYGYLTEKKGLQMRLPEIQDKDVKLVQRILSYNITADFFDSNDKTLDKRHSWFVRRKYVIQLLRQHKADVICLQELSPIQAYQLAVEFVEEYESVFLSQTPSEIEPTGAIVRNQEVKSWINKICGTPLIGIFYKTKMYSLAKMDRFWLNESPNEIPTKRDRGKTDKGFGNMNTYRAVLWIKLESLLWNKEKAFYIFNSHYPLDGDTQVRFLCAQLERKMINQITQGKDPWISTGDRNLVSRATDNFLYHPATVYQELTQQAYELRFPRHQEHYGLETTWLGFTYDSCQI